MTTATDTTNDFLVLDTGLFNDHDFLSAALQSLEIPQSLHHKLDPENMNDADWDNLLNLVLSTKCVISL